MSGESSLASATESMGESNVLEIIPRMISVSEYAAARMSGSVRGRAGDLINNYADCSNGNKTQAKHQMERGQVRIHLSHVYTDNLYQ